MECKELHGTEFAASQIHPGGYLHIVPNTTKYKADMKALAAKVNWFEVAPFCVFYTRKRPSAVRRRPAVVICLSVPSQIDAKSLLIDYKPFPIASRCFSLLPAACSCV